MGKEAQEVENGRQVSRLIRQSGDRKENLRTAGVRLERGRRQQLK